MTAPLWALLLIGIGGPVLTSAVTVLTALWTRRNDHRNAEIALHNAEQQDARVRRGETGRNVRFAIEIAMSSQRFRREAGLDMLQALIGLGSLDAEHKKLISGQLTDRMGTITEDVEHSAAAKAMVEARGTATDGSDESQEDA